MRIGIVGGGQLARMLALAGYPLGLRFLVLDPAPDACAGQVAELLQGAYDDQEKLAQLADRVDLVTFDFENVPAVAARFLEQQVLVYPPPLALETAQDRLSEKTLFQELGVPTPPFAAVNSLEALHTAVQQVGLPAVLKTRCLGYDGKGQWLLREPGAIEPAWQALGGVPLLLEGFVPFQREVSLLALRGRQGETAFYPLVENRHQDGILYLSLAPYQDAVLEQQAQAYAGRVLERLGYAGLLAIEFFVLDGQLLANEMAPRVHNSGHWTIEGAETSQFENHLRALLRLPLGSTTARGGSAMLNLIGELPDYNALLAVPGVHVHIYGKAPQPGRKLGHATLRVDAPEVLQDRLAQLLALLKTGDPGG
jgi:5-(carboxyamino)imidazole ribonucleotide synthase